MCGKKRNLLAVLDRKKERVTGVGGHLGLLGSQALPDRRRGVGLLPLRRGLKLLGLKHRRRHRGVCHAALLFFPILKS